MRRSIMRGSRCVAVALSAVVMVSACSSSADPDDSSEQTEAEGDSGSEADAGEAESEDGSSSEQAAEPTIDEDGQITYAWSIPLSSLDPHATPSDFDPIYIGLAYDTLVVKEFDGSFSPMLAESWEFSDDGSSLEMTLRDDVVFHGGREFDAEAVALNFDRVTTLEGSSRGDPLAEAISNVEVVDPLTVRFELGDGAGVVLGALSSMGGMMVNPDSFDEDLAVSADGTGPYRVASLDPGVSVSYEKFDQTWASEDARAASIEIVTNVDSSQRVNQLLTGQVDATNIDSFQIDQVESEGFNTHFRVGADAFVMQLNWERLADVSARQAMIASIDRGQLLQGIHDGVAEAGGQVQTEGDPAYNTEIPVGPELERAAQLAEEAGLEGETLQLLTAGVPNLQAYAEALQPMLGQLGVTVEVTLVEFGQLSEEWASGAYDLSAIYFTGNPDLAISYDVLLGEDSALNPAGTAPGELQTLLDEAYAETDPEARTQIFKDVAAEAHGQAVVAVLVHPVQPIVTAPDVLINEDRLRLFGGFNLRGIARTVE